uniref:RING-type E3 ubiquitin transferase n=1 Tax=Athene cunicularia TaxID=194338 RepID=A0A663MU07_ATHCN
SFSSATPAAASPQRGSSSPSPSMATEPGSCCPICLDSWDDAAYVLPCLHQFCYRCILRWAETKPECPLFSPVSSHQN